MPITTETRTTTTAKCDGPKYGAYCSLAPIESPTTQQQMENALRSLGWRINDGEIFCRECEKALEAAGKMGART